MPEVGSGSSRRQGGVDPTASSTSRIVSTRTTALFWSFVSCVSVGLANYVLMRATQLPNYGLASNCGFCWLSFGLLSRIFHWYLSKYGAPEQDRPVSEEARQDGDKILHFDPSPSSKVVPGSADLVEPFLAPGEDAVPEPSSQSTPKDARFTLFVMAISGLLLGLAQLCLQLAFKMYPQGAAPMVSLAQSEAVVVSIVCQVVSDLTCRKRPAEVVLVGGKASVSLKKMHSVIQESTPTIAADDADRDIDTLNGVQWVAVAAFLAGVGLMSRLQQVDHPSSPSGFDGKLISSTTTTSTTTHAPDLVLLGVDLLVPNSALTQTLFSLFCTSAGVLAIRSGMRHYQVDAMDGFVVRCLVFMAMGVLALLLGVVQSADPSLLFTLELVGYPVAVGVLQVLGTFASMQALQFPQTGLSVAVLASSALVVYGVDLKMGGKGPEVTECQGMAMIVASCVLIAIAVTNTEHEITADGGVPDGGPQNRSSVVSAPDPRRTRGLLQRAASGPRWSAS